jgi:NADPH-dependent 2,4-dienoyl-CoA reductase/sulfur reductase-like enzyme/nitrite reductase/ring-hydroxylating ferredoxin subunit
MGGGTTELQGPDFEKGVPRSSVIEGTPLLGHAQGEAVLLVRLADQVFAIGATCTHYSGPLAEGLLVGATIRCPWHHAAFDVRSGDPVRGPALNSLSRWRVELRGESAVVTGKLTDTASTRTSPGLAPSSVVIVGAGAAGQSAAEVLRREGYVGRVTLIGREPDGPVDRPNLSKDYLAGTAPEEWIPLRGKDWYESNFVEVLLNAAVNAIDTQAKTLTLSDGRTLEYGALILATGADPIRLDLPGVALPHVHTLRSLADSRAIIARAKTAKRAVVVGSSFIGLEAASALRARGLEVAVVGLESVPLQKVLGDALGAFVRKLHEEHGVVFHLGTGPKSISAESVTLQNGTVLPADLVILGVGVRPNVELAQRAGLKVDNGVVVDAFLETSAKGVYAAGDIASWPDARTGKQARIEHWVVAERQGATAARNALGERDRFDAVPFFWSQHYDVPIAYVGIGAGWDAVHVAGNISDRNCIVSYKLGGKVIAAASIYRDRESLEIEAAMERGDEATVNRLTT